MSGSVWYLWALSILFGVAGFFAFLWALKTRQFDDPEEIARKILDTDD